MDLTTTDKILANTTANETISGFFDVGESDGAFLMICAFLFVTRQTGLALLQSGFVDQKNEVDVMIRNVVDKFLGGFSYWLFGFAFMLGKSKLQNPFIGLGRFAVDVSVQDSLMGQVLVVFLFELTFSTIVTSIVGGAIAERYKQNMEIDIQLRCSLVGFEV